MESDERTLDDMCSPPVLAPAQRPANDFRPPPPLPTAPAPRSLTARLSASALHLFRRQLRRLSRGREPRQRMPGPLFLRSGTSPVAELIAVVRCGPECGFCHTAAHALTGDPNSPPEALLMALERLGGGVETVSIGGDEPAQLVGLPGWIEVLTQQGLRVELRTNGAALQDPDYARWLAESGLRRLVVSLNAADVQRAVPGLTDDGDTWNRAVAGIDNAIAAGLRVELHHEIDAHNFHHVRAFLEFGKRRWKRRIRTSLTLARHGDGLPEDFPSLHELVPHVRAALAHAKRHLLRVSLSRDAGIPPCLLQPHARFCDVARGRVGTAAGDDHRKTTACRGCRHELRCPGVRAAHLERDGDPGLTRIRTWRRPPRATATAAVH